LLKSLYHSQSIQLYRTPSGSTIGSHRTSSTSKKSDFSSTLANAITKNLSPNKISSNSPLVRFGSPISNPPSLGGRFPTTPPSTTTPGTNPPTGTAPAVPDTGGPHDFEAEQVGQIDRAPMAFFEHDGELVVSGITRNGISETPVWTYTNENGVQQRSVLPEAAESGATGYSFGNGLHLTPESWGGAIDYTAASPDGPWYKHDYTSLVPHDYTNLKWGFSYQCPVTGQEYMGFGNGNHPGMVISKQNGEWQVLAAPGDMRFPTGVGVISTGSNKGTTLISSCSYGYTVVHAVEPDGSTRKVMEAGDWGVLRADHRQRVNYLSTEEGRVYWSSFDNPDVWKECKYIKPSGQVDKIEPLQGEPNIHPDTGTMIFPAMGDDGTALYEARREGDDMVLEEVLWMPGIGEWSIKTAIVDGEFYLGTGKQTGQEADRTPGVIYKIDLENKTPDFGTRSA
jgi:hypothetical protein